MDSNLDIMTVFVSILSFLPNVCLHTQEFVYDDSIAVLKNTDVTNHTQPLLESFSLILQHDFWGQNISDKYSHKSYRPITTAMYHLETRYLYRSNVIFWAIGMKFVNIAGHSIVCNQFYGIMCRIFQDIDLNIVFNSAILFAVHPIHVEVINSIVGRADLLCTGFFLLAFQVYLDLIDDHERNGRISYLKAFVLIDLAIMSLFSKEIGIITLPFCAAYDVLANVSLPKVRQHNIHKRFEFLFRNCANVIKRCIFLAIVTIGLMILRGYATGYSMPHFSRVENPIAAHSNLFTRLFTSCYIHALNFWLLLCPDWLCCDWSHDSIQLIESWTDHRILFAILLYLTIYRLFVINSRNIRICIAFLVIPYIPSSHIIPVGFVLADRVLYIPSIGYCLLIGLGINQIQQLRPNIIRSLFALLVLLFIFRSNMRSFQWQNNYELFKSALNVCPNNAKIYYNLGQITALHGNYEESIKYNLIADKMLPNSIYTLVNLGNAYRNLGDLDKAIEIHKRVIELEPRLDKAWMNLGITYVKKGDLLMALDAYRTAYDINPKSDKTAFNLGNLYLRLEKFKDAEHMYRRSIEINPNSEKAHMNLIVFLIEHGSNEKLMDALNKANLHILNNAKTLVWIASALAKRNIGFDQIESLLKRALQIDPNSSEAHLQLAMFYYTKNNEDQARNHLHNVRKLYSSFQTSDEDFFKLMKQSFAT